MREFEITARVKELSYDELTEADRELVDAAREATRTSYVPYSHFHVGAAIRMSDGSIVRGSNQENAAYPSGICAERSAAFHAGVSCPGKAMRKIAIAAWTMLHSEPGLPRDAYFQANPISPCGACRQALLEYEARDGEIEVILYGRDRIFVFPSIASLLPFCFTDF